MVRVVPEDRDFLRFLWFDDPDLPEPELVTYRFTRVMFGVSSSLFLLNATIRHHVQQYNSIDPSFVLKFRRSVYVDDLTTGGDNVDYCYELYQKSKSRLAEGGFNLRKFKSNSGELLERIKLKEGPGDLSVRPSDNFEDCKGVHKVLGIHWDPKRDELLFDIRQIGHQLLELKLPTKRTIVGIAAKIYDPLGILSPVTIIFKVFFQKLCKAKLGWDDPLSVELQETWQSLVEETSQLDPIAIPRYLPNVSDRVGEDNVFAHLVGFCDASKKAYAAVVYIRVVHGEGVSVSLLLSKTRVSPMKDATIPKLELLSSLLLARLVRVVQEALDKEVQLEEPVCYTDSMIALAWIQHDEREWKQFVENRVSEIRKLVAPRCWHHCPGVDNVADIPSRGVKPKELQEDIKLWLEGPEWLKGPLPRGVEAESVIPEECAIEAKVRPLRGAVVLLSAISEPETLIDPSKFSTFGRLRRVMTKVFKFIRLLKHLGATCEMKEESTEDSNHAYRALIHIAQKPLINDHRFQTWKYQFELFSDDTGGILRCKGRLVNADIPSDTKFPIILDKSHVITHLIVKECHEKCRHGGVNSTLAELRAKYWVIQGRQLVKRLIHSCVLCRWLQCQSYQAPAPPTLPPIGVNEKPPFSYTGIDFAGPLYTRESLSTESRKVWICLFTCCVTRAAHLELVTEMKTEAFLCCFKRFTSRRGFPIKILTDNAKTFQAVEKWLLKVMRQRHPTVKAHLQESGVS